MGSEPRGRIHTILLALFLAACHGNVEDVPLRDDLLTLRDRFFDVFTRDGERVVVVGYSGKILLSDDGGESWRQAASGTEKTLMRVDFADRQRGWIVGQNGIVLRTADGGETWSEQTSGTENHLFGLAVISPERVFACGDRSQWVATNDGGETWNGGAVPLSDVGMAADIALAVGEPIYYDVFFLDGETGWMVGDYGNIRFTADGGRTWQAQHQSLIGQQMPGALRPLRDALDLPAFFSVAMRDREHGMVSGVGGVLLETRDGGGQWALVEPGFVPRIETPLLDILYVGKRPLILGGSATALAKRATWKRVDLGLPVLTWFAAAQFASEGALADRRGFTVGGRGLILRTDDGGGSWRPVGTQFPTLS